MSSNAANSTLTPAEQVVNTTELLEHILSSLPMPHVLGKSRVSHDWKALIDNSPTLQKKLFLRHNPRLLSMSDHHRGYGLVDACISVKSFVGS